MLGVRPEDKNWATRDNHRTPSTPQQLLIIPLLRIEFLSSSIKYQINWKTYEYSIRENFEQLQNETMAVIKLLSKKQLIDIKMLFV